jgi:ubiquinone/menaquinone biosynthesis C-methylase UbiE
MARIMPDLTNPRYRDEVGWFLYHEKYGREKFGGSYDAERVACSRLLLEEVLRFAQRDIKWLVDKTVVSIGCGCTGDMAAFPAAMKIGIDPLLHVYQKLGLLMADEAGGRTVYLSLVAETLPLLDDFADLVICRNALDHMPKPELALDEFRRIIKDDGFFFASVDIGGEPTPDEPTVFSTESLRALIDEGFDVLAFADDYPPHSKWRVCSTRIVARKKPQLTQRLDREMILRAYESHLWEAKLQTGAK